MFSLVELIINNTYMALRNIKVLEFAGLAPVPLCGLILKDFGADVIRIDKVSVYLIKLTIKVDANS